MNIVNLIHIGDEVKNFDDLTPEERQNIAIKLNIQALTTLGYVQDKPVQEETAS